MSDVKLPLSGDVTQAISPWTSWFSSFGNQYGINVNIGRSTNAEVEKAVIGDVASYGKQLGRMQDALVVLLSTYKPSRKLKPAEREAIDDLRKLLDEIAAVRQEHGNKPVVKLQPGVPHS